MKLVKAFIGFIFLSLLVGCNQQTMTQTDTEIAATAVTTTQNSIAVIETNYGTMEIELFEQRAPITTKKFYRPYQKRLL